MACACGASGSSSLLAQRRFENIIAGLRGLFSGAFADARNALLPSAQNAKLTPAA
jgi:hypothetical protein